MVMEILIVGITIISVLVSFFTGLIAISAWIELRSFMKSTHKIEYVPFEPELNKKGEPMSVKDADPLKEYGIY